MDLKPLKEFLKPTGWKIAFFLLMIFMIPPMVTVSLTIEFFIRLLSFSIYPTDLGLISRLLLFYIMTYIISSLIVYFQDTGKEKILWIILGASTVSIVILLLFSLVFGI